MTIYDVLYSSALFFANLLYGYAQPPEPPTVAIVSHEFLVDRACGGVECKVLGWYNDEGIIYLDERAAARIETNALAQSILVHEIVHYLQHVSGRFPAGQCEVFIQREREAYAVSDTFLIDNGWVAGPHMGAFGTCAGSA